jgi:AcrR family transcriptional regulator
VAEAAEAADVSRRTAYRYFPTQEQLLTEAALESLRTGIESSFASIEEDPEARVEAAVRAMQDRAAANEGLLRTMIRLTVERRAEEPAGVSPAARGSRRIEWIESALEPVRDELSKGAFSQLVSAISLCVGAEALIVLRDVRGLSPAAAADVSAWSAKALLRAALAEASSSNRARARRK